MRRTIVIPLPLTPRRTRASQDTAVSGTFPWGPSHHSSVRCMVRSDSVFPSLLHYAKNVGWLLVPVLLWNAVLSSRLPRSFSPEVFRFNIPTLLSATENALRIAVFALPFFAPLELATRSQEVGIAVFCIGLTIYFLSWLPLIAAPDSRWSLSAVGFLAPAYTPLVWLLGMSLLMQRLFWQSPYHWWFYLILSIGFLVAHIAHTAIVFTRLPHASVGWPDR